VAACCRFFFSLLSGPRRSEGGGPGTLKLKRRGSVTPSLLARTSSNSLTADRRSRRGGATAETWRRDRHRVLPRARARGAPGQRGRSIMGQHPGVARAATFHHQLGHGSGLRHAGAEAGPAAGGRRRPRSCHRSGDQPGLGSGLTFVDVRPRGLVDPPAQTHAVPDHRGRWAVGGAHVRRARPLAR